MIDILLKRVNLQFGLFLLILLAAACGPKASLLPHSLEVNPPEATLTAGDPEAGSIQLEVLAFDADGRRAELAEALWESSDSTVAGVSGQGLVTAQAPGAVEIRVSHPGAPHLTASSTITVLAAPVHPSGNAVPHLYITTENNAPVDSKDSYIEATLRIDGKGAYNDYLGSMNIRGRGNSTWNQPKKPYRLKLDSRESLLGLAPAKNWILLANYLDITLMGNALAMQVAHLLEMPHTHNIIPVDVTLNGEFQGSYMFTEQKEVSKNRIDTGVAGVYIELDTHDKSATRHEFTTPFFELPAIIKHPRIKDIGPGQAGTVFAGFENDFNNLVSLIAAEDFPENGYRQLIDVGSLADYLLVFHLSANRELNHPKSVYLFRVDDGPYQFGPVWDFDWAWGYSSSVPQQFRQPAAPLLTGSKPGTRFFKRLLEDPVVAGVFRERWREFRTHAFPALLGYTAAYAELIADSYAADYELWAPLEGEDDTSHRQRLRSADWEAEVARITAWLHARAEYLDTLTSGM